MGQRHPLCRFRKREEKETWNSILFLVDDLERVIEESLLKNIPQLTS
jgi:hypothetical protein